MLSGNLLTENHQDLKKLLRPYGKIMPALPLPLPLLGGKDTSEPVQSEQSSVGFHFKNHVCVLQPQ